MDKQNAGQQAAEPGVPPEASAGGPEAQEDLEARLRDLQVAAASYFETLSDMARRLTSEAEQVYTAGQDQIREHPAESLLGAAALGFVLGFLLDRM